MLSWEAAAAKTRSGAATEVRDIATAERTFVINSTLFCALVIFSLVFHWRYFIRTKIINIWSFEYSKTIILSTYRKFLRNMKDYYKALLFQQQNRASFLQIYGLQVYFYLYLELLKFLLLLILAAGMLVIWFCQTINEPEELRFDEFIFGNFDFEENIGLVTVFSMVATLSFYMYLYLGTTAISEAHFICFGRHRTLSSRLGIMPNVIYVSKIKDAMTNDQFRRQMSEKLDLQPKDYIWIRFASCAKLYRCQISIDLILTRLNNPDCVYWWFIKDREAHIVEMRNQLEHLREEYNRHLAESKSETGAGLLCIFSPSHLDKFFRYVFKFSKGKRKRHHKRSFTSIVLRPILGPSEYDISSLSYVFLFSYDNFNFANLNVIRAETALFKVALYSAVLALLGFITTPLSFFELAILAFFGSETKAKIEEAFSRWKTSGLSWVLMPLLLSIINVTFLIIIERIARFQRFYRYSSYCQFVLRFSFIYLMINTFIIPGFAITAGVSLYRAIISFASQLDLESWIFSLRLYENSNVVAFTILQSGAVGFFLTLNVFSEGFLNAFRYNLVLGHFKKLNNFPYLKKEGDLFEFGYYYAYNAVILYLVYVFGIYRPVVIIAGAIYFGLKSFADLVSLTHYYGQQFDSGTVLPNMHLNRAKFCISLMHLLLACKSLIVGQRAYAAFSFAAAASTGYLNLTSRVRSFEFSRLFQLENYGSFGEFTRTAIHFSVS